MSKQYAHETKIGMLKYKVDVSETTSDDDGINILVSYESYETGIAYESAYDPDDIGEIHKLFCLDPTLMLDMIGDNKLITDIKVDSKEVRVFYKMTFMKRTYKIVLKSCRVTHEGVDPATGDLQCQNKVLLRQVSKLTNRIDYMERQLSKLAIVVAYNECGAPLAYRNQKTFDIVCDMVDMNEIHTGTTYEKNKLSYACAHLIDGGSYEFKANYTVQTLLKHGIDMNKCDAYGKSILIGFIEKTSVRDGRHDKGKRLSSYVSAYIKAGADVNTRDASGKTALMYCEDKIKQCTSGAAANLPGWNNVKSVLLHAGAK